LPNCPRGYNGTGAPSGTFSWTAPFDLVGGNPGDTVSHSMTFTPNDTVNINTVTNMVTITVWSVQSTWARTVSAGSSSSQFSAVTVDASGNVYAAGSQAGTGAYTYGAGVTATGTSSGGNVVLVKYDSGGTAQWARTVSAGSDNSQFNAVAVDASGNVYAAGYQFGTGAYTYGAGVSATGIHSQYNVVLVKYNSSGTAQWARTVSAGSGRSQFSAVTVDASGNVYAAGYQSAGAVGAYTYGTGVSATGTYSDDVVLVKYNSSGTAQWARTVSAGSGSSYFRAVAVDASGNVYAAGVQSGTGAFTYGAGVTATGTYSGNNVVLVKYDSGGTAQWARTVSAGGGISEFNAVAADPSGNVYAAGYQSAGAAGAFTYGAGVSATGTNIYNNVVLVKYNSSGNAQWARTVSAGSSGGSQFNAVTVDASGNVYAAGYQNGTCAYGTGVSATGNSVVLVKYNSSGTAQWAPTSVGGLESRFHAVAADPSGNVYAAGYQYGTGAYTYGDVSATGTSSSYNNVVLVKYIN